MREIVFAMSIGLLAAVPALAEEEKPGRNLMEDGARLFLEGILREMEPAIDELEQFRDEMEPKLRDFADKMGPALEGLMDEVKDWSAYHPPVILPNGDILIRKKTAEELEQDQEAEGETEI